jgi:hypothetical protein
VNPPPEFLPVLESLAPGEALLDQEPGPEDSPHSEPEA